MGRKVAIQRVEGIIPGGIARVDDGTAAHPKNEPRTLGVSMYDGVRERRHAVIVLCRHVSYLYQFKQHLHHFTSSARKNAPRRCLMKRKWDKEPQM